MPVYPGALTGQLHRKVMRINTCGRPQWREFVAQVGMAQLHHPFRPRQIAQRMHAQIGQPRISRQPVDNRPEPLLPVYTGR